MSENEDQIDDAEVLEEPRTNHLVRRGFDSVSSLGENAATQALTAKAIADIQARWTIAMRVPRDMDHVRAIMMRECKRPGFAEVAVYEVPRGDKKITGLSIRFAEVAMRCMGNMSSEAQTIFDSSEERIIRITATDYETNASWMRDITVKKTVEKKSLRKNQRAIRERINSSGDRVYIVDATDDEVATKEAAEISKKSRTAILRLIPGHLQDEALKTLNKTFMDKAAKDPDTERNILVDTFAEQNIFPADLTEWLGSPLDRCTPAQIVELRRLYVALRDGHVTWGDAMEAAKQRREKAKASPTPAATTTQAAPAASEKAPAAAAPAASSGKGTQAAKDKIKQQSAAGTSATDAKPAAASEQKTNADTSPDIKPAPKAAEVSDGNDLEMRECFGCGDQIEVKKSTPKGALCKGCAEG